jgi:hypothetical protein
MHLTPEQLVDAADAVIDATVEQHLAACVECRAQVAEFRETMVSLGELERAIPEPSPFFWTSFQRRVVEAVDAERRSERAVTRLGWWLRPARLVPAALLLSVGVLVIRLSNPRPVPSAVAVSSQSGSQGPEHQDAPPRELLRDSMDDDPSLQLIADLAVDVDWSEADADALTPSGSADHAVSHLNAQDLKELQRLLRAELGT